MIAAHTPTPWRIGIAGRVLGGDGLSVVSFNRKANAAFIVRAVNAHDDLVAALRKARNIILQMGLPDEATDRVLLESGNALDKSEGRS
jgi:hypothetical protein